MSVELTYFRPGGWAVIDVAPVNMRQLVEAVETMVQDLVPRARSEIRSRLLADLEGALTGLEEAGAFQVLLPAAGALLSPVRPILALYPPIGADADPVETIISLAASEPSAQLIDLPGRLGVRTRVEHDSSEQIRAGVADALPAMEEILGMASEASAQTLAGLTQVRVQVRYHVGVPGDTERWLSVFATFGHEATDAGRAAAETVEGFLDDWIATVGWVDNA